VLLPPPQTDIEVACQVIAELGSVMFVNYQLFESVNHTSH
jgi:hypothetical protein